MQNIMLNTPNLTVQADQVNDLLLVEEADEQNAKSFKACGVLLENGFMLKSKSVVITTGTFLRANVTS